jgi:ABC-type transporter Mla MlaB component
MLSIVRDRPAPSGHEGLLADSDDHRQTAIGTWTRSMLDRGEKLLTLAAPAATHSAVDIAATREGRDPTALTPDHLHTTAPPVALLQRALAQGYHGLGILIEADAVITATSRDTHAEIETVLTDLCRDHPVSVLCLYDRSRDHDRDGAGIDHLDLAVARHPDGLHEQQLALRRDADTLQIDGEIDVTNLDVLGAALRALTHDNRSPTVRIDLTGVTFLAAAAARPLNRDTAPYRARGAHVEIHATPHTTRILQLLDIHTLPQLHLTAIRPGARGNTMQDPARWPTRPR